MVPQKKIQMLLAGERQVGMCQIKVTVVQSKDMEKLNINIKANRGL